MPFAKKMLDATQKAIGMPETAIDGYNLEIADRVGDARIFVRRYDVSGYANLSECWHSSSGLEELKVAASCATFPTWPEPDTVWC